MISLIEIQLQSEENQVCIIEDTLSKPQDPYLSLLNTKLMIYDDEVYHVFTREDIAKIKNNFLRIKTAPTFIGAITSLPIKLIKSFNTKKEVDFEDLEVIVNGIEKLFVGAYDGESYIIWSKNKL